MLTQNIQVDDISILLGPFRKSKPPIIPWHIEQVSNNRPWCRSRWIRSAETPNKQKSQNRGQDGGSETRVQQQSRVSLHVGRRKTCEHCIIPPFIYTQKSILSLHPPKSGLWVAVAGASVPGGQWWWVEWDKMTLSEFQGRTVIGMVRQGTTTNSTTHMEYTKNSQLVSWPCIPVSSNKSHWWRTPFS